MEARNFYRRRRTQLEGNGMIDYLKRMIERYPALEPVSGEARGAYEILYGCYRQGGKGNFWGTGR